MISGSGRTLVRPQQPISRNLVIFGHLIQSETAPTEPLGVNVLKTDTGPAAAEEAVGRVEGSAGLLRAHEAAPGGTVATSLRES